MFCFGLLTVSPLAAKEQRIADIVSVMSQPRSALAHLKCHMTTAGTRPPPIYKYTHTHTGGLRHCLSSEVSAFSIVLYRNMDVSATECLLIVILTSRHAHQLVEIISGLFRGKVFMNGKLAFGRCNTYFDDDFLFFIVFHAVVLCNVMGTDQSDVSTVIKDAFLKTNLSVSCV